MAEDKKNQSQEETSKELHMVRQNDLEFKNLINKRLLENTPKEIIPESLVGDRFQKEDMISRTQSAPDSSQASDSGDD